VSSTNNNGGKEGTTMVERREGVGKIKRKESGRAHKKSTTT